MKVQLNISSTCCICCIILNLQCYFFLKDIFMNLYIPSFSPQKNSAPLPTWPCTVGVLDLSMNISVASQVLRRSNTFILLCQWHQWCQLIHLGPLSLQPKFFNKQYSVLILCYPHSSCYGYRINITAQFNDDLPKSTPQLIYQTLYEINVLCFSSVAFRGLQYDTQQLLTTF